MLASASAGMPQHLCLMSSEGPPTRRTPGLSGIALPRGSHLKLSVLPEGFTYSP